MRPIVLSMCLMAAACSSQGPESPLSPTSAPAVIRTPSAATAAPELPFSGTISGTTRARFPAPGTLEITLEGAGTASHLGHFEMTGVDTGRFPDPVATGTWMLTAANQDQLFAKTESRGEPIDERTDRVTTTATISGGTGRFAGATGSFTVIFIGIRDESTASGSFSGSFEGHLDLKR